jgi:hypothetical protein
MSKRSASRVKGETFFFALTLRLGRFRTGTVGAKCASLRIRRIMQRPSRH